MNEPIFDNDVLRQLSEHKTMYEFNEVAAKIYRLKGNILSDSRHEFKRVWNHYSHPELRKGEVFFTNATEEIYATIDHESKRRGDVAYTVDNSVTEESWKLFPVFLSIEDNEINGQQWVDDMDAYYKTQGLK